MATAEQCLEQLDDVFRAARDPSAAYLIRSRLRRAVLSCSRLVADASCVPKPERPGDFPMVAKTRAMDVDVLGRCERIYAIAGELCQPSESFDARWEEGWASLRIELDDLRTLLEGRTGQ